LGQAFWDDLDVDGVPTSPEFLAIYEPFNEDDGCEIRTSVGISEILLAFVFAAYSRNSDIFNTDSGNESMRGENATRADIRYRVANAYNEAVTSIESIQWYIEEDETDYPDYNGQQFNYYVVF